VKMRHANCSGSNISVDRDHESNEDFWKHSECIVISISVPGSSAASSYINGTSPWSPASWYQLAIA
jgi:hypothetical protein